MKWIGQHIYDLISRFRDDVYLEDLATTTDPTLPVLVVGTDGLVTKNTAMGGDITSVVAGAGMTGGGTTGDVTLNVIAAVGGGIDVTADAISVDVSDFMGGGADNYVLTATGADTMQAEAYFQFENTSNVSTLSLISDQNVNDLFTIATTTNGATTLTTLERVIY